MPIGILSIVVAVVLFLISAAGAGQADIWIVYEVDEYDAAYEAAQRQRFGFREHEKYLVEYTR